MFLICDSPVIPTLVFSQRWQCQWNDFDYINFRGIELVKSLDLYTIEERRDYFLAMLMFKSIHGIAPAYLCNQIVMKFDINGYDNRGTDGMNVY